MGRAFQLLLFLHGWISWEQISRCFQQGNIDSGEIMNNRCDLCGLFGCQHVKSRLEPTHGSRASNLTLIPPAISLGEPIGDAMENFSNGVRVKTDNKYWSPQTNGDKNVTDNKSAVSTIPMGPTPGAKNVVIPAPPKVPLIASPSGQIVTSVNKSLQTIDIKNEWVHCNICSARVNVHYLDQHLKVHTHNYEPKNASGFTTTPATTSTAIVRVPANVSNTSSSTTYRSDTTKSSGPKLKSIECYKYRQLDNACAASSVSQNGRYSDFTIILWGKEKTFVNNTVYVGGYSSTTSKDWERFSVHVVYDSKENYYTVTCKLLRRSSYSTFDSEDNIPDRICYQDELLSEIKRALLFFRISPRAAYKQFLKCIRGPLVTEYDKTGRAIITQTKNCEELNERLKKTSAYTGNGHGHWAGMHGEYDYA
jgi:hypothetical protein